MKFIFDCPILNGLKQFSVNECNLNSKFMYYLNSKQIRTRKNDNSIKLKFLKCKRQLKLSKNTCIGVEIVVEKSCRG